jgi:hypothetical protein
MGPNRRAQERERAAAEAAAKAKRAEAERIAQNDLKIRLVKRKRAASAREAKEAADYLESLAEAKDEIEKSR